MEITKKQIEEGQKMYSEFQRGMTGGFFTALFHAISRAKAENIFKMDAGFPGEVYAFQEYTGSLDPYQWDIEGETISEKFARLVKEPNPEEVVWVSKDGFPVPEEEMISFASYLDAMLKEKGMK